jgi:hypothetical protein
MTLTRVPLYRILARNASVKPCRHAPALPVYGQLVRHTMLPLRSSEINARSMGYTLCGPASLMNSGFSGRWDRNRTGTLRFWSLLPHVQLHSRKYTRGLNFAHFDAPTCQDVHQSSPALGSTLGSNVDNTACSLRAPINGACRQQLGAVMSFGRLQGSRSHAW